MKHVIYFLEDRAQEQLVTALVERIAREEGVRVQSAVRSARGGHVLEELRTFASDLRRSPAQAGGFDILVVAIDANCDSRAGKVRQIRGRLADTGVEDRTVYCVPDPHIERWYLLDPHALRQAAGQGIVLRVPRYKCEKSFYKKILADALAPVGSLLGGAEYGREIALALDYGAGPRRSGHRPGLAEFVEELRRHLRA